MRLAEGEGQGQYAAAAPSAPSISRFIFDSLVSKCIVHIVLLAHCEYTVVCMMMMIIARTAAPVPVMDDLPSMNIQSGMPTTRFQRWYMRISSVCPHTSMIYRDDAHTHTHTHAHMRAVVRNRNAGSIASQDSLSLCCTSSDKEVSLSNADFSSRSTQRW